MEKMWRNQEALKENWMVGHVKEYIKGRVLRPFSTMHRIFLLYFLNFYLYVLFTSYSFACYYFLKSKETLGIIQRTVWTKKREESDHSFTFSYPFCGVILNGKLISLIITCLQFFIFKTSEVEGGYIIIAIRLYMFWLIFLLLQYLKLVEKKYTRN